MRPGLVFSLVGVLPSTLSAAPACCSVALFEGLIGSTTPSDSSPPFMPVARLSPSPAGLPLLLAANDEVSRFSCMQFLSVPGVCDYVGSLAVSRWRLLACGLPLLTTGSASQMSFSKLNTQPTDASVHASMAASRPPPQDSRPGGSLLLSCRTLSFPTTCRFIPAHGQPSQRGFLHDLGLQSFLAPIILPLDGP